MTEPKRDARALSGETQAELRRVAVRLAEETGLSNVEIASVLGVNSDTVSRWRSSWRKRGEEVFAVGEGHGHNPRTYNDEQEAWIVAQLAAYPDPRDLGYDRAGWTLSLIRHWLLEHFGKAPDITNIRHMLLRHGFSTRAAQKQAREAKEEDRRHFEDHVWPEIEKQAQEDDAVIVFLDECGVRQEQVKLRTWAPEGSRPVLTASGRRAQVNVISALSFAGELWFDVFSHRLNADTFIGYLDALQAFWPGKHLIVVTDKHPAHVAKKTQAAIESRTGIELVFLPSYMPKFNPDESVWQLLKHIVLRARPVEIGENVAQVVRNEMEGLQNNPSKLQNLFGHPDLAIYSAHRVRPNSAIAA